LTYTSELMWMLDVFRAAQWCRLGQWMDACAVTHWWCCQWTQQRSERMQAA